MINSRAPEFKHLFASLISILDPHCHRDFVDRHRSQICRFNLPPSRGGQLDHHRGMMHRNRGEPINCTRSANLRREWKWQIWRKQQDEDDKVIKGDVWSRRRRNKMIIQLMDITLPKPYFSNPVDTLNGKLFIPITRNNNHRRIEFNSSIVTLCRALQAGVHEFHYGFRN